MSSIETFHSLRGSDLLKNRQPESGKKEKRLIALSKVAVRNYFEKYFANFANKALSHPWQLKPLDSSKLYLEGVILIGDDAEQSQCQTYEDGSGTRIIFSTQDHRPSVELLIPKQMTGFYNPLCIDTGTKQVEIVIDYPNSTTHIPQASYVLSRGHSISEGSRVKNGLLVVFMPSLAEEIMKTLKGKPGFHGPNFVYITEIYTPYSLPFGKLRDLETIPIDSRTTGELE